MQSSPSPLEFFVDRSLGRQDVPTALRLQGLAVRTMASEYEADGQFVEDQEWLRDAVRAGWVVLTKDKRLRLLIRRIPALHQKTLRVFILMNGNLAAAEQVEHFVVNLERIEIEAREPGPFAYGVYERRIRRLWPTQGDVR